MKPMTSEQKQAYEWGLKQEYPYYSVSAWHVRVLADYIKDNLVPDTLLQDLCDELWDWYGIGLSQEQMKELLVLDPILEATLKLYGCCDTVDREKLADTLLQSLDVGRNHWPTNGEDTPATFWHYLWEKCTAAGYTVKWKNG